MSILLYDLCGADSELRFSPHCWKAKFALAHKGLDYRTTGVPFTEVSGIGGGTVTKTVPVIDDNGRVVTDSFAIAEYLDDTYPERPLFGSRGRALARFVENFTTRHVSSVVSRMIIADIHDNLGPDDQAYFRRTREERLGEVLEAYQKGVEPLAGELSAALGPLRHALADAFWLGGDTPLFADYIVAGPLMWLRVIAGDVPLKDDDPVGQWFDRLLDLHGGLGRNARTVLSEAA